MHQCCHRFHFSIFMLQLIILYETSTTIYMCVKSISPKCCVSHRNQFDLQCKSNDWFLFKMQHWAEMILTYVCIKFHWRCFWRMSHRQFFANHQYQEYIWWEYFFSREYLFTNLMQREKISLREKCPNSEFFLVLIFPYSVRIQENTDQKKLLI